MLAFGDSNSGVLHRNHGAVRFLFQRQANGTWRRRVLKRVIEQNVGQPAQYRLVAHDKQIAGPDARGELQVPNGGHLLPAFCNSLQSLAHVHRLHLERFAAGVRARQREQLLDQRCRAFRFHQDMK